ncbi:MAG TPA: hypothetical protein DCL76_04915 [Chloroflexi bacterium]|nr:hypothetical protein [Chloroflexota bacterium]HCU97961.1 hypothetical protein [Chloroflexota bacterium]
MSINITIKLFAIFRDFHPGPDKSQPIIMTVEYGTKVSDLVDLLCLPKDVLRSCFINNESVEFDAVLQDLDVVSLFPPVSGGDI